MITKGEKEVRDKLGVGDQQRQATYIEQIRNKDSLYSARNDIQYPALAYNGKKSEKDS